MAEPKQLKKKRVVVVMYDTLCRHFMPTYGNEWIKGRFKSVPVTLTPATIDTYQHFILLLLCYVIN